MLQLMDYKDIGMRIREKRKQMGFSQAELSERTEISPQHLSNVENGKNRISLETLVRVANTLECTMDELVCGSVKRDTWVYCNEIGEMVADFSVEELRALLQILHGVKQIRK